MHRILLVEDHVEARKMIPKILGPSCLVTIASTLKEGYELVDRDGFDLILLDVTLPDGAGFKLCAHVKQREDKPDIPVIFLTGSFDIEDKVTAFSLGAEDYVVKPFNSRELRARVFARLGRSKNSKMKNDLLVKGDLRITLLSQRVHVTANTGDVELPLTPLEFKLLVHFARNEDRVLSRDRIISAVWGENVHILDRTIDAHVSNLRKKLGPSACAIKSVHGEGYRFMAAGAAAKSRKAA
ncbi:MAG: response regulator transcription factor [Deltaproteobacteria bacterium]|nr:response regulator transcription factor [Deltaproteobacteria bacterium]